MAKKTIYRGELPKKEELGQFADLRLGERGGSAKKRGMVFLRWAKYPNAHYGHLMLCFL